MSEQRSSFTVAYINRLEAAPDRRLEVHDARVPGWVLRITPRGVKTFSYVYRRHGRHRRVTLGRWPVDPRAQAKALAKIRERALELQAQVAAGRDPLQEERERQARRPASRTLAWAADRYVQHSRQRIKTWQDLERILANHWLPTFGEVPLADVRRVDLYEHVLDPLLRAGRHGAAGQAKKAISGLFNFAVRRGWLESSPAAGLTVDAPPSRRRALRDDELAAVWLAAAQLETPWRQAVRLILLTGCRRSEISEARWSEITRDRWLVIPAERYKTGAEHHVPLSEPAWAELQSLPRFLCRDPYILSARGGVAPIRGWGRPKERLDEMAGAILGRAMPAYRLHDLRHTFRTRLAMLGIPHDVAELAYGHKLPGVAGLYNHYDYRAERRQALDRYAAHVLELASEVRRAERA